MWVEKYTVRGKVRYRFGENYKSPLTGKYKKYLLVILKIIIKLKEQQPLN